MFKHLHYLATGIFALLLSGCTTLQTPEIKPALVVNPPLRVGITPQHEPLIYKQGQDILGLEADFARALGRILKRDVECVELTSQDLLPSLEAGTIDIVMSGLVVTKARKRKALFAKPYFQTGQLMLMRSKDVHRFRNPQTIVVSTAKVGVEKNTAGDYFVRDHCPRAERVSFSSAERGSQALLKGSIDVFIHDAPTVWSLASKYEAKGLVAMRTPLNEEALAWAVGKRNKALLSQVNAAREEMVQNGRMSELLEQWLP